MMRRRAAAAPAAALAGMLALAASCAPVERFEPEPFIYADRPQIRLAVDRVEVVNDHRPSGAAPFIEHTLEVPPALAATALLQSRLVATGSGGTARAVIAEGSMLRQELPTKQGVTGFFTREPEAALSGRLEVRVEIVAPDGEVIQSVTSATAMRRTIREGTPPAAQRRIAYELVRDMVDNLDAGLEANIRENFTRFLAASPPRGA